MASTDYITEQQFLDYIKSNADTGNELVTTAITTASRAVDAFCNRVFYQQTTTLYYAADPTSAAGYWILPIDDLATTSGLIVKTDANNDGVFERTLTLNTDFVCEPINQYFGGIQPWPYTSFRSLATIVFPFRYYPWQRPTVSVTGTFGWPAVPKPVEQATKILTAQYVKLADAPLGVAGWGAYGDIKVKDIPQAATLLLPYADAGGFGVA
jgi:hypothetical protein